jgi:hypothetical protein
MWRTLQCELKDNTYFVKLNLLIRYGLINMHSKIKLADYRRICVPTLAMPKNIYFFTHLMTKINGLTLSSNKFSNG